MLLEVGNWFGEISLLDRQPRTDDATALPKELKVLVAEGAVVLRYRRIEITCAVRLNALSDPSR